MTDWIQSCTNLARHRKTRRFAEILGVPRPLAVGYLTCWWHRVMEESPEGDLSVWTPEDIADAALYDGNAEHFRTALIESGFLDVDQQGQRPHDWEDYAGRLIERRHRDAQRKRDARARTRDVPSAGRPNELLPRPDLPDPPDVPDRTDLPDVPDPPSESPAPAPTPTRAHEAVDEAFIVALETEFGEALGSAVAVRESISTALGHKRRLAFDDPRAYVRNWVRRDVERVARSPAGRRNGHGPPSARAEMAREFAHLGAAP